MDDFDTALTAAVGTSTHMIGGLSGKGVIILLSVITGAVLIIFIKVGWRKGWAALQGKVH